MCELIFLREKQATVFVPDDQRRGSNVPPAPAPRQAEPFDDGAVTAAHHLGGWSAVIVFIATVLALYSALGAVLFWVLT